MNARGSVFKVVLVGEGGVGKTSLVVRYTEDRFDESMKMTIGVNLATKKISVGENEVTLLLWDLGGQPRFREVVSDYFRGSKLAIAVFDASRPLTMYGLDDWIGRLKESVAGCDIVVLGNQIDEREPGSGVLPEQGAEYAAQLGAKYFETSAKTGEGVKEAFQAMASLLLEKHIEKGY
ncbi:MAG: Rab family GTPase [Candidatus Thorarchaeota archaeon]